MQLEGDKWDRLKVKVDEERLTAQQNMRTCVPDTRKYFVNKAKMVALASILLYMEAMEEEEEENELHD